MQQSGFSSDLGANTTDGKYTVKEAYAELNIPVLKNKPFAQLLSFDLATRHSNYSSYGSTNNSKASFMWKPVNDLLARGTWAQGFRAPAIGDTFGSGGQSFDVYVDPCDSKFGEAARNPTVAARCVAAGVPADFRQPTQTGSVITTAAGSQGAYAFNAGVGNDSLQPERAVTKTFGLVYNPSYLPGLSGSLDYYNITVSNRITAVTASWVANQCYVQNAPAFCSSIVRSASGEVTSLSRGTVNLGALQTDGLDLSLAYRLPRTRYGQFVLRSDSTFVTKYRTKADNTLRLGQPGWRN